jgi:hypothetical protein
VIAYKTSRTSNYGGHNISPITAICSPKDNHTNTQNFSPSTASYFLPFAEGPEPQAGTINPKTLATIGLIYYEKHPQFG